MLTRGDIPPEWPEPTVDYGHAQRPTISSRAHARTRETGSGSWVPTPLAIVIAVGPGRGRALCSARLFGTAARAARLRLTASSAPITPRWRISSVPRQW